MKDNWLRIRISTEEKNELKIDASLANCDEVSAYVLGMLRQNRKRLRK